MFFRQKKDFLPTNLTASRRPPNVCENRWRPVNRFRSKYFGTGIKYKRYRVFNEIERYRYCTYSIINMGLREGFSETVLIFNHPVVTNFERVRTCRECAA
jgi:hypothetical protein